jgi:FkbM family methyltransferase
MRRWLQLRWYSIQCKKYPDAATFGTTDHWTIRTAHLTPESIVYAAGVGGSITFEKAIVERFGLAVWLLDPTPPGISTMALACNQHPRIHFLPLGLAGQTGSFRMSRAVAGHSSFHIFEAGRPAAEVVTCPCVSLSDLMRRNGHGHIDLLKMDIEGFEYGVLDDLCRNRLPVDQVCVEFHPFGAPPDSKRKALRELKRAGFRLFHRHYRDYSFTR